MTAPLRLRLDGTALAHNWRLLDAMSGAATCGAAVKANGYGLGGVEVAKRLAVAGCRDFFVSTWAEAAALAPLGLQVSVLHGVREEDMTLAMQGIARPILNTASQVSRWQGAGGAPCDVMIDTGMNRLGLSTTDVATGLLEGLAIETLLSHLACADEDSAMNARQLAAFAPLRGKTAAKRLSLANSAGVGLGPDYAFDLTRPGLALYGGVPRPELAAIRQVATPEAQILQRRTLLAGQTIGYNATYTATADKQVAILNIGYADGYFRGFSNIGTASLDFLKLHLLGRVSMDLIAIDVDAAPDLREGDWLALDYALPEAANRSGMSQYELLTSLGDRFDRFWA